MDSANIAFLLVGSLLATHKKSICIWASCKFHSKPIRASPKVSSQLQGKIIQTGAIS